MKNIPLEDRIIFALDFADPVTARQWVEKLDSKLRFFKVGLQLFLAGGWPVVEYIIDRGNKVMLDLKFFDIPATVGLAVEQLRDRGIFFATVHGNDSIIRAAVSTKGDVNILAVTVLTSFDESDMRQMGMSGSVRELVMVRAGKALELGCDGLVCSPLEAAEMRSRFGQDFFIVTPGIRPGVDYEMQKDDQRRIATARQAMIDGADYVVIGRPIRNSPDPLHTVEIIQQEITEGLQGRTLCSPN